MEGPKTSLRWFYHEFGLSSIHNTGRNAYLIILARTLRMFAYGTNNLILAIFFSRLNYTDHQIGIFFTLTLLGDVFLGTYLTLVADRVGRRKVMLFGSVMMIMSGIVFASFENFWVLLFAAVLGVVSITGGDFGPFRSIEESVLSQLTTPKTRSDVLAWYVTTAALGSSVGSEASGRIVNILKAKKGWTDVDAYHALFWVYTVMGFVNVGLVLALTNACELSSSSATASGQDYVQVPQDEAPQQGDSVEQSQIEPATTTNSSTTGWRTKVKSWLTNNLTSISPATRSTMYKLWFLLSVDSLADGMVPWSLTNYYLDINFHPSTSTLGDVTSISYFLAAIGASFAGPLARRIGLINTMVFTHVPSSAAVLFFPFAPYFWVSAILLFIRAGLNNMDQAPRAAFIAAVVKPEERTAIMGITSMLRTLSSMAGPTLTGVLAESEQFWIAFVMAGLCRLAYDFGLYAMFVNMKLYENENEAKTDVADQSRHLYDEEDELEMSSLADSSDAPEAVSSKAETDYGPADHLQPAITDNRVRERSPHRSEAM